MTLEALAHVGEFLGGSAVIISLLYLAIQIRQNSRTVRATAYRSFQDSGNQILTAIAQGPAPAETFTKGLRDFESLDPTEAFQFITLLSALFATYQVSYFQYQDGLMPERQWNRQRAVARWWAGHPGVQPAMALIGSALDPDFLDMLTPRPSRSGSAA